MKKSNRMSLLLFMVMLVNLKAETFFLTDSLLNTRKFVTFNGKFTRGLGDVKTIDLQTAEDWLNKQSVTFLENAGQMMDVEGNPIPFVLFKAEAPGINFYITEKGLNYVFVKYEGDEKEKEEEQGKTTRSVSPAHEEKVECEMAWINMHLKGATIKKESIVKELASLEDYNFFYPHCPNGIYGVKKYEKITIKNVYPGIDWVFYNSDSKGLKYDFIVHPGADPTQIKMIYESAKPLTIDKEGNINIKTPLGTLSENAPYTYLQENSQVLQSSFTKTIIDKNNVQITFKINNYNAHENKTLVIDPQLVWATIIGSGGLDGTSKITHDNTNNVYISGYITAANFPLINPGGGTYFQLSSSASLWAADIIIAKFSNTGTLLWSTYYGGNGADSDADLKCDNLGNLFMVGQSGSVNFPTQNPGGGAYFQGVKSSLNDMIIIKFNGAGIRQWATYLGGNSSDWGSGITFDNSNNIFITGGTASTNFPTLNPGGGAFFQGILTGGSDATILKFSAAGVLIWSTFYGGNELIQEQGNILDCDITGNIYVAGNTSAANFPLFNPGAGAYYQSTYGGGTGSSLPIGDAFMLKFSNSGVRLWATYYGGSGDEKSLSLMCDNLGNAFVVGFTNSTNLPTFNPGGGSYFQGAKDLQTDAYILKFSSNCAQAWATYYGGNGYEGGLMSDYDCLSIDVCDNIYITFTTGSTNLTLINPCNNTYNSTGPGGKFISEFLNNGTRVWANYLADFVRAGIEVDGLGSIFITGETLSSANLVNPGGGAYFDNTLNGSDDGFICKFIQNPPTFTQAQVNPTCACNGLASVSVCGIPPFNYVWSNGSQTLATMSNTNSISGLCPGVYTCTISSNCNIINTRTFTLTGSPGFTIAAITSNSVMCYGASTATAIVTFTGGIAPFTYSWSNGATTQSIGGLGAGNYTVVVSDSYSCTTTATTTIMQPSAAITATVTPFNALCFGASTGSATVNSNGGTGVHTYSWSNGQTASTATNLAAGNYSVTVTDGNNCQSAFTTSVGQPSAINATLTSFNVLCFGTTTGSATVNSSGGTGVHTYSWNNGQTAATASNLISGNYSVTVTDNLGCSLTVTTQINQPNSLAIAVNSNSLNVCEASNITLTANASGGTPAYSYTWNQGPAGSVNVINQPAGVYSYTVIATDVNTCSVSGIITVTFNTVPVITVPNATVCFGQIFSITANGANSYTWQPMNYLGSTYTASPISNQYLTVVGYLNGCTASKNATVFVNPLPFVNLTSGNNKGCVPLCITFTANSSFNTQVYTWNFGNETIQTNAASITKCYNTAGNFSLATTITDQNGCSNTSENYLVEVYPKPIADFNNSPVKPIINMDQLVSFTDASYGANITGWSWYFMNTSQYSSQQQNPTFMYNEAGNYVVALVVKSDKGCADTLLRMLVVGEDFGIYVPDTFTPNGDGLNDIFQPKGFGITKYELNIFDRWGQMIFTTKDFYHGWDGFYKGEICKDDVYVWEINLTNVFGKSKEMAGHVTLLK